MKRLIPEEVAKLFAKHNIKPKAGCYFNKWIETGGYYKSLFIAEDQINKEDVQACCGIGVCLYDVEMFNFGNPDTALSEVEYKLGFDSDYRRAFERGFDSGINGGEKWKDFINSGYEDGWKTAQLVRDKQEK